MKDTIECNISYFHQKEMIENQPEVALEYYRLQKVLRDYESEARKRSAEIESEIYELIRQNKLRRPKKPSGWVIGDCAQEVRALRAGLDPVV